MICSLCKSQLVTKRYNSAKVGVHWVEAHLCPRCDLAPDPPVRATAKPD